TAGLSALFKYEPGVPVVLRFFMNLTPAMIPPILIVAAAILLNGSLRNSLPVQVYKVPLLAVSGLAALGLLIGLGSWMIQSGMQQKTLRDEYAKFEDRNTQRMLD